MMKLSKVLSYVLLFVMLFSYFPVQAEAAVGKSVTIKTQSQLESALSNVKVSKITIKPTKNTRFFINSGDYHKNLVIYQTKVDITNNGSFDNLNIIVTNENELSDAVNTYDIDTVTVKTTKKSTMQLNSGNSDIKLVVDSSRLSVVNNSCWESIDVKNSASWAENAQGNNFIVSTSKFNITTNEAAVESIYINRSSAILNIKADSTIESITAKNNATINLSGKFEGQVLNSIIKENIKGKVKASTSTGTYSIEANSNLVQLKSNISKTHIHDAGAWVEQTATTTRIGAKVRYCTSCRAVLEIITSPALKEEPSNTEETTHTHEYVLLSDTPASCTTIGTKTYRCADGDDEYVETTPATGHDQGTWYEQKATTSRTGVKVRACTKCGAILESVILPKLTVTPTPTVKPTTTPTPTIKPTVTPTPTPTVKPTVTPSPIPTATPTPAPSDIDHSLVTVTIDLGNDQTKEVKGYYDYDMAQQVYTKLNDLRTSKGLNTLSWNSGMAPSADIRAAELTVKFDHWRPNGEYCYDIYTTMSSENVAMGYTSASDVMTGWINSPAHYSAMIKADYKSVSISCFMYEGLPGQYIGYWSMLFSKN